MAVLLSHKKILSLSSNTVSAKDTNAINNTVERKQTFNLASLRNYFKNIRKSRSNSYSLESKKVKQDQKKSRLTDLVKELFTKNEEEGEEETREKCTPRNISE